MQSSKNNAQPNDQANAQPASVEDRIIQYCTVPRTLREIQKMLGFKDRRTVRKYIRQLIACQRLTMTEPEIPNHPNQKYVVNAV